MPLERSYVVLEVRYGLSTLAECPGTLLRTTPLARAVWPKAGRRRGRMGERQTAPGRVPKIRRLIKMLRSLTLVVHAVTAKNNTSGWLRCGVPLSELGLRPGSGSETERKRSSASNCRTSLSIAIEDQLPRHGATADCSVIEDVSALLNEHRLRLDFIAWGPNCPISQQVGTETVPRMST